LFDIQSPVQEKRIPFPGDDIVDLHGIQARFCAFAVQTVKNCGVVLGRGPGVARTATRRAVRRRTNFEQRRKWRREGVFFQNGMRRG
jgi:hypothetical protein